MALIRNFPVPSDRMAIISTLLNIEDAVVLEYGPEGTTHFSMNFFNKLGQDYPDRLFTTGVDDSDIIMGSTEHLERGILELDALYSPKAIFVLTSSVTSIIGTDIAGICDSLQSKVQSRLIPVNTSGLGADYSAGLRKIYLQLAELFVQPDAYFRCITAALQSRIRYLRNHKIAARGLRLRAAALPCDEYDYGGACRA